MQIISFVSFKGGAGKTTALQLLCSGLCTKGRNIALLETDENAPLTKWHANAQAKKTWDARCTLYHGRTAQAFRDAAATAEAAGTNYLLVDTAGGGSEINTEIIVNSSMVVVPTAITSADIPGCVDTLSFLADLKQEEGLTETLLVAVLVTRLPRSLNRSRNADLEALMVFPMLDTLVRDRDALAGIGRDGMLHLTLAQAEAVSRFHATHFRSAMAEAGQLGAEVIELLEGEA